MSKVAVVFWSGTGNTEAMADKVAEGAKEAGAEVSVFSAEDFSADKVEECDGLAFGCPAMGDEELEDTIFEPMYAACEPKLAGKKVGLFGSYGWGDGEWMRDWEERMANVGAVIWHGEGLICCEEPDEDMLMECEKLGEELGGL